MRVVGIDPGLKGGIAGLDLEKKILWAVPMPLLENKKTKKFEYDIARIVALLRVACPDGICLEAVHSMPKDGKASAFKFGMGFGILLGIIGTLDIPLTLITPQSWKKSYGLGSDKELSRKLAYALFPLCANTKFWHTKSREGVAEAALLARFGAAQRFNNLDAVEFLPHNI